MRSETRAVLDASRDFFARLKYRAANSENVFLKRNALVKWQEIIGWSNLIRDLRVFLSQSFVTGLCADLEPVADVDPELIAAGGDELQLCNLSGSALTTCKPRTITTLPPERFRAYTFFTHIFRNLAAKFLQIFCKFSTNFIRFL